MYKTIVKIIFVIFMITSCINIIFAQQLRGRAGSSSQFCSGWIDLRKIMDFQEGDTLIIGVGGTAKKVLVRLLAKGEDPNSASGIVGGPQNVPKNRTLKVILESDYNQIVQISVHGGSNPFYVPLGENNGCATLINVILNKHRK